MKSTIAYFFDEAKSILFLGRKSFIRTETTNDLITLQSYLDKYPNTYKAIALSYDLKNEIYNEHSNNNDRIDFPNIICWEPEHVLSYTNNVWSVLQSDNNELALKLASEFYRDLKLTENTLPKIHFLPTISKDNYLHAIKSIQEEIQFGNTYETNFCQEFYAENIPDFNSFQLIKELYKVTKAPFSAYLHFDEFELFCGSPERFLKKEDSYLYSQPIKGTIARGVTKDEDIANKQQLLASKKDFSENVMIVDLVRNDLSQIALKGSVKVEELAAVHSFETVHHLISTISCEVKSNITFTEILKATFPMGSMTGAPKLSTMQISEREEHFKRGIYSGSIGYITSNGNFDLNVVIRSLVKNNILKTMTCAVGGAITIQSEASKEYEECMAKVGKILAVF
jgi:para-aminobenzoate synthetase component 1